MREVIFDLNRGIEGLADAMDLPLLDPFAVLTDDEGQLRREYDYGDGAHLNVAGYRALGEFVRDSLAPHVRSGMTIGCLGDSLTEGYPYSMATGAGSLEGDQRFRPYPEFLRDVGVTPVNMGVAGDTTLDMLRRAREIVPASMDVCLVMGGTNDIFAGREVEDILGTLELIYSLLRDIGTAPVAMTVPPVRLFPGLAIGIGDILDITHSHQGPAD